MLQVIEAVKTTEAEAGSCMGTGWMVGWLNGALPHKGGYEPIYEALCVSASKRKKLSFIAVCE